MSRLLRSTTLAALLATIIHSPASAYFINCGPGRNSLFHISQYGSFYRLPDGRLSYQYFNDMQDKKTVDPRCARLLGGVIPLYPEPAGF